MVGELPTKKLLVVTALPALVLPVIGPSAALVGTTATTWFWAVTVPLTGLAPAKGTVVPPMTKLPPKRVTDVGCAPLAGLNQRPKGATVNVPLPAMARPATTTLSGPVPAPNGTTT